MCCCGSWCPVRPACQPHRRNVTVAVTVTTIVSSGSCTMWSPGMVGVVNTMIPRLPIIMPHCRRRPCHRRPHQPLSWQRPSIKMTPLATETVMDIGSPSIPPFGTYFNMNILGSNGWMASFVSAGMSPLVDAAPNNKHSVVVDNVVVAMVYHPRPMKHGVRTFFWTVYLRMRRRIATRRRRKGRHRQQRLPEHRAVVIIGRLGGIRSRRIFKCGFIRLKIASLNVCHRCSRSSLGFFCFGVRKISFFCGPTIPNNFASPRSLRSRACL
jgi:hypothetical protein